MDSFISLSLDNKANFLKQIIISSLEIDLTCYYGKMEEIMSSAHDSLMLPYKSPVGRFPHYRKTAQSQLQ